MSIEGTQYKSVIVEPPSYRELVRLLELCAGYIDTVKDGWAFNVEVRTILDRARTTYKNPEHTNLSGDLRSEMIAALIGAKTILNLYTAQLFGDEFAKQSVIIHTIQSALERAGEP